MQAQTQGLKCEIMQVVDERPPRHPLDEIRSLKLYIRKLEFERADERAVKARNDIAAALILVVIAAAAITLLFGDLLGL